MRQRRLKLWLRAKARRKANDLEPTRGSINCFAKIYILGQFSQDKDKEVLIEFSS